MNMAGPVSQIYSDNYGRFEFPNLNPGTYEVQVETDGSQMEVINQSVQVYRGAPTFITFSLRDRNVEKKRTNSSNTISVGELGADVPKSARKEFEHATRAAQENKFDKAIAHLRKAIVIHPSFVMALNDLGALLLAQGKLVEAEQELRRAVLVDEKAFNPRLNLGIVLVQGNRFIEAADVMERAVALNTESPAARLYAGMAQAGISNWDAAAKHLRTAYTVGGSAYALALFHLGQVCMNKGERAEALEAFEAYLRDSPTASNADQVHKLIAILRP